MNNNNNNISNMNITYPYINPYPYNTTYTTTTNMQEGLTFKFNNETYVIDANFFKRIENIEKRLCILNVKESDVPEQLKEIYEQYIFLEKLITAAHNKDLEK